MPEVGIKRLGAGDGEEHHAKRNQSDDAVLQQEIDAIERIKRPQHARIVSDPEQARQRDGHEPDQHDRAEQSRDLRRAARLCSEQNKQDDYSQRHDIFVKRRRHDIDTFDGGQHRQGWRDHGIAIEQRGADNAEEYNDARRLAGTSYGA